jgi:hypothetical protein
MPIVQYEIIEKSKVENYIHQRYYQEIAELETLGFHNLYFTRELSFEYSALVLAWMYPFLKMNKEIFQIEAPFRYVHMNPFITHSQEATYCQVLGLGVVFTSCFMDGSALISCSYPNNAYLNAAHKIYKYAPTRQNLSIEGTWKKHQLRVVAMEKYGYGRDFDLNLDTFERIAAMDSHIMLRTQPRQVQA